MIHYVVVRTAPHTLRYLDECWESIIGQPVHPFVQTHQDGSKWDDEVFIGTDHHYCRRHGEHLGVAGNLLRALRSVDILWHLHDRPTGIVSIVDGDDMLPPKALWRVQRVYEKYPDTLITYGSYIKMSKGRKTKISQPYPDGADVRTYPWRGSHLKTFRASLLPHIREEWFKDEKGNWLQAASDLALMIPLMELAGLDRCRHISRPTYIWRDNTPWKTNRELQKRCEAIVRAKPREKRLP